MKVTKQQLRRIIREALTIREGYSVPRFSNSASMEDWVDELVLEDPDAEVDADVVDPETGELIIPAGESASEQIWFQERDDYDPYADAEGVAKMAPDEDEEELEDPSVDDDRIQDMVTQQAVEAGQDWAADTLYDAKNNPNMWQRDGHASAEDYVMSFGQDAAGDIADNLLKYGERDIADWWSDLPDKEDRWGGRPTKSIMRDVVADYFYDGVSKTLREKAA